MINVETVDQIVEAVYASGVAEESVQALRRQFPDIHFTYCSDDDVFGPKPVRESKTFNLYLIDGRDHCLAFTNDADIATGIVVAEVLEDDV